MLEAGAESFMGILFAQEAILADILRARQGKIAKETAAEPPSDASGENAMIGRQKKVTVRTVIDEAVLGGRPGDEDHYTTNGACSYLNRFSSGWRKWGDGRG